MSSSKLYVLIYVVVSFASAGCGLNSMVSYIIEPSTVPAPSPSPQPSAGFLPGAPTDVIESKVGSQSADVPALTYTSSADFYVDAATGDDTNDGSVGLPWRTISKAAATLTAGQRVYIKNGTYRERVTPANSGTSTQPIIYEAFAGHSPVVKGSDLLPSNFVGTASEEEPGIFNEGFESGDFTAFSAMTTGTVDATNSITSSTANKSHGTHSALFSWAGTSPLAKLTKTLSANHSDVSFRTYFYLDSGFDLSSTASFVQLFKARDASLSQNRLSVGLKKSGANIVLYGQISYLNAGVLTTANATPGTVLSIGAWHYLEVRYQGGSATGVVQFLLDGVSVYSQAFDLTGLVTNNLELGSGTNGSVMPVAGSKIYLDSIKMNGTPIGAFSPTTISHAEVYKSSALSVISPLLYFDGSPLKNILHEDPDFVLADIVMSLPRGYFYQEPTSEDVYLRTPTGATPNGHAVEGLVRSSNFEITNIQYLVIKGLTFKHANKTSWGSVNITNGAVSENRIVIVGNLFQENFGNGVRLTASSYNHIVGNKFIDNKEEFGSGIRLRYSSSYNTLEYNTVENTVDYNSISTDGTGYATTFDFTTYVGGNGIYIGDPTLPSSFFSNHNIVRHNRMNNVLDSGVYLGGQAEHNEIYSNIISNTFAGRPWGGSGGNGIHLAKYSSNNFVGKNVIYNVETAGLNIRYGSNNNTIYNNTVFRTGLKNTWLAGKGSPAIALQGPTASQPTAPASAGNKILNNVFYTDYTGSLCLDIDPESVAAGTNVLNFNVCYNSSGGPAAKYNGTTYTSFEDLRAFGQEASGQTVDPLFESINIVTPDLKLKSTSPVLEAGSAVPH